MPPVDIRVRDLSLLLEQSTPMLEKLHIQRPPQLPQIKRILQNVSLDIPAGSLMAIIGASGSGKVYLSLSECTDETSLLNLIANRIPSRGRMKMEGRIEFNGGILWDIRHSYVVQEDILLRISLI